MAQRETISDAKRRELDAFYKNKHETLPKCPTCQSKTNVIPSVRGKPSHDLLLYAGEGHVKLSGCTQTYNGWCKTCEKFL